MELRQLRYFVALAETLHFGRAADQLRIAQPSLSQQIQRLEAELRVVLLERTRRHVRLTEPGRLFLEQARRVLAQADHAAVVVRSGRGGGSRLRVGVIPWMDLTRVAGIVRRLESRSGSTRLELLRLGVPEQLAGLRDESLDLAFLRPPLREAWLQHEFLCAEPFVVALPARHRLASRPQVRLEWLADERYVTFPREKTPYFFGRMLDACRGAGFAPDIHHEVDDLDLIFRLVAEESGVALVPASARRLRRPGVAFRSLRPAPPLIETEIAWRRDHDSPLLHGFLALVREVFRVPGARGEPTPTPPAEAEPAHPALRMARSLRAQALALGEQAMTLRGQTAALQERMDQIARTAERGGHKKG